MSKDEFEVIVVNGKSHYLPSVDELKALKKIIVFLQNSNYEDRKSLSKIECLYSILENERITIGNHINCETIGEFINSETVTNKAQNTTFHFLDECCVDVTDAKTALSTAQMWQAFCQWCKNNNEYTPKRRAFTKSIANRYHTEEYMVIKKSGDKRYYPFTLSDKYVDEYIKGLFRDKGVIS